jgi:hypothetical protein
MSVQFLSQTEIDVIVGRSGGKGAATAEKRGTRRYAFPTSQFVAPFDERILDLLPAFCPTRFHDLSTRGVSFYWPKEPDFEKVLLLMSGQNMAVTALGEVVRCARRARKADNDYLVGCRLVKLLSRGALP